MWSLSGLTFVTLQVRSVVQAVLPSNTRMFRLRFSFFLYKSGIGGVETDKFSKGGLDEETGGRTCTSER